jgi:hypothetical protein
MFVPISYLNANGHTQPALLSKGLFVAVERALAPLCKKRGWLLRQKPSCVRIRLDHDAHIDVAIYSIPDGEFLTLVEKALHAEDAGLRAQAENVLATDELPEEIYRNLAQLQIMLAHRVEGWKPSDPRKLEDWFKGEVKGHGEHLRRVCRYLKGWRDFNWEQCRLSSIVLMAAAVEVFRQNTDLAGLESRDDKTLLAVCEQLPAILSRRIENPVVPGQWLDEGWSPELRNEFVQAAEKFLGHVRAAITTGSAAIALTELRDSFGDRIPDDASLIQQDNGLELKSSLAAPAIKTADESERLRRAELAAREVEARGQQSKPWASEC